MHPVNAIPLNLYFVEDTQRTHNKIYIPPLRYTQMLGGFQFVYKTCSKGHNNDQQSKESSWLAFPLLPRGATVETYRPWNFGGIMRDVMF